MSGWDDLLPKSLTVGGTRYDIRSDYRDIRWIITALTDAELDKSDRAEAALTVFYPDFDNMPPSDYQEALDRLAWFINCGRQEKDGKNKPKLIDWEKDFVLMVSPVNKVLGTEIRALEYLHWWTYRAAWDEIDPNCTWAQVLRIRNKKAKGKPLEKEEAAWYRENRDLIDIAPAYTKSDLDFLSQWGGANNTRKEDDADE